MSRTRRRTIPSTPWHTRGADLHVHTTHSDGVCSPGEVVRAAASVGLEAVAITDHDTLSALSLARPEADRLGIELVPGIELSARDDNGREIHLLGHYVDPEDDGLRDATEALRQARLDRLHRMIERLADLGMTVDPEAMRRAFPRAAIGRRHLAEYLVRTGQVASRRLVFARYLGDNGPAMVSKPLIPWAEAIALIRRSGGVAGLAHPPFDLRPERLLAFRDAGLGAIEVHGPGVNRRQADRRRSEADRLGLIPLAGSDFHAPDRPGRWVGAITTPRSDLDRLRLAARCGSSQTSDRHGQRP